MTESRDCLTRSQGIVAIALVGSLIAQLAPEPTTSSARLITETQYRTRVVPEHDDPNELDFDAPRERVPVGEESWVVCYDDEGNVVSREPISG